MNNFSASNPSFKLQEPVIQSPSVSKMPQANILIVDDDHLIAKSIYDFLELHSDYNVSIAGGGLDAQAQLEESLEKSYNSIDLLLLDIDMPGVSGIDVLKWIRDNDRLKLTRVLMLTGIDNKRDMVNALQLGADDYITKPHNPQELLARIRTQLRTQQLEKQLQRQKSQLAMLNTISNAITKTLEMKDLMQAGMVGVRELMYAETTAIYMYEQSRDVLRCNTLHTSDDLDISAETTQPIKLGTGVISRAFSSRVTHCIVDAANDARFMPDSDVPKGYSVDSMIAAPIYMRGHPIGVVVAFNKLFGTFTPTDVDLFASLASTITQAIDNASLFHMVKQRQHELLESRNTLQALIDGILHPIYTINDRWQLQSINKNKADSEELEASSLVGKLCYEAFFQRSEPCEHCQVAKLLASPEPFRWTVRWVGADYLPQEWDVNAYPIPTTQARSPSAVIVWQDRTEERRMESSLHQAAKLSAIGQLAAGVAHEINNPLTVISTGAEMLKDVISPEQAEDYELVEWISNATAKATKVVRGLLDFARQSRYEFHAGSLSGSIEEAIELVTYQIRRSSIEVVQSFPDDLPEVVASWEHLKTVWVNLLINARDALKSRDENRRIEITARHSPDEGHVQLFFHDNGEGIPEEQVAHIFVPFYTTKDPGEGTGLGLATVHRIIDRHGGEITVTSETGRGTTFIIRLPISEVPQPTDEQPQLVG